MRIGNVDVKELVRDYQTPLYVYDEGKIKSVVKEFKDNFKSDNFSTDVLFACKALDCLYMYNLANKLGLCLDCVTGGEIYGAYKAGFNMKNVFFHGNNKSEDEILMAGKYGVGNIIIDNLDEVKMLEEVLKDTDYHFNVMMRINIGVSAHTHQYIITAHPDSKFGFFIESEDIFTAVEMIKKNKNLSFKGFHSHIGSQIFDKEGFLIAVSKLFGLMAKFDFEFEWLNLGGGFGIKYTDEDKPIPYDEVSKMLIDKVNEEMKSTGIKISRLLIEPGRSIVGEAGYTLYTIGQLKKTKNKMYYFIDGGMSDNIRPALYQAKYACDVVDKESSEKKNLVCIAGKCCESGDVIIEDILLPEAKKNDILVVYSTGAYGYSMSSNYNKMLKPAMVFVDNGNVKLACKRQSYDDLYANEEI